MNIANALTNLELNNKYNSNNIKNLKLNELKKQYHILALNYHPDKNNNEFSKEHFQNINNSYLFLKNIIEHDYLDNDYNNSDENIEIDHEYYNLIINFINIITKDINNNITITDFQNDCKKYIYEIIQKFINKLNLNVLEEIYKILNNIHTNSINIDEKIKNIILENIKTKLKNYNIYIINPKLNNILNSEVYIMEFDNKTIYIPLWHNELNDNNNIFKIEPILNDNISIDENNNIHYSYYSKYEDLINLIRINKDDFPYIEIIINKYNLTIPIKELNFKKYQTYVFKEIGIPKINIKNVFENNNKANIIIHIYLE
tara:strand:+ start:5051 stop:5998 length:948 start_codon:yes stop_codon:yes gene_type:complete